MPRVSYNVAPRYTAGSPALVDEETAMRVADDEKKDYERLMDPSYAGIVPADEEKAKRLGLAGIVEARSDSKDGWAVTDVLTGERFWRGDVKVKKIAPHDRIVRCPISGVHDLKSHDGTPHLPIVVDRVQPLKPGFMIYGKDLHGNEAVLLVQSTNDRFKVERGR